MTYKKQNDNDVCQIHEEAIELLNYTKVYLSAGQEQSELRLDQLDEELNNIADGHQRDIDGTV